MKTFHTTEKLSLRLKKKEKEKKNGKRKQGCNALQTDASIHFTEKKKSLRVLSNYCHQLVFNSKRPS